MIKQICYLLAVIGFIITLLPSPVLARTYTDNRIPPQNTKLTDPNLNKNFQNTGIDVYGLTTPYNQDQLTALINNLNQIHPNLRNDTYYGTIFVTLDVYNQFLNTTQENIVNFLARNSTKLSTILKTANPPVLGGYFTRRLIIVNDPNINYPASYHFGYQTYNLRDSDGTWFFNTIYNPADSYYYDATEKIDYGLLHEFGHNILHLNDQYDLDVAQTDIPSTLLSLLPVTWQQYFNRFKHGISDEDLMSTVGHKIQEFTARQLSRRANIHDFTRVMSDYLGWNPEFPNIVKFRFSQNGNPVNPAEVQIYSANGNINSVVNSLNQTKSTRFHVPLYSKGRTLKSEMVTTNIISGTPIRTYSLITGNDLTLNPSELFQINSDNVIANNAGTLLLIIKDNIGKQFFRWLDVREFNLAKWTNTNILTLDLPINEITPDSFNWIINYSSDNSRRHR
jgi:hypothetical protein